MKDKVKVEQGIADIFSALVANANIEKMEHPIYKQLMANPDMMKNPRYFDHASGFGDIKDAVTLAIQHTAAIKDPHASFYYQTAFFNFDTFNGHVRRLVEMLDGSACCADKSGVVVGQYLNFLKEGVKGDWNPDNYWIPDFGTQDEWFEYMRGLCDLQYGNPKGYFNAYKALIEIGQVNGAKAKYVREQAEIESCHD